MLIVLFIGYSFGNLTPLSECKTADITYYEGYDTDSVACHLGTDNLDTMFRAAPNEAFYLSSQQCGICYEAVGEKGSIRFMVTDLCPANGNSDWCASDKTHFDLAANAFPKICEKDTGHCDITYRMVACDVTGNVKLLTKEGVSEYWLGFYVRNYVIGLKGVKISFGSTNQELTRTSNYWAYQATNGNPITTPITITLTSIAGDTATIIMNDIVSNKIYEGNNQFSIPDNTFFEPTTLTKINKPSSSLECCPLPSFDIIFTDSFHSFWTYTNKNSVTIVQNNAHSGSSALKASLSAWGNFQILANSHTVLVDIYDSVEFYIKSNANAEFWFWAFGKTDASAKTITTTTEWQKVSFKMTEIGNDGTTFGGIEFQSKTNGNIDFYLDDIKLILKEGSCNQMCSDHTPSNCSTIIPDNNDNSHDGSVALVIVILSVIITFFI
ncbi:hypothetical protein, conserved [Entamoeba dispar SAW760]|uniref:Expansin-like EG45 domain-containing protein n=1 Tax=Entamoeba dispar (strain ATCC PRA-260 / SAW760) TaxID=370354 RepID=B0EP67_ENTDS|nr:uncharacterized protein EDI_281940 [Entamoeba dispar SAW760]EDR23697.1 hypothetical protein, conserved [Entamoeba dispar SAW760]|eukprot:EDR23697.1 hypothetical protein, conserved [Entamoeba dispar SAW760]